MHLRQIKEIAGMFKEAFSAWTSHKTPRFGAALAYYTVFAIAPLFLIALSVAGFFFGKEAASQELFNQVSGLVGHNGGQAIQSLVAAADKPRASAWATAAAITTLLLGATAVFVELQDDLNTIWNVEPKPGRGLREFIRHRLLSFAMVLGVGFLLLVSLSLNAALAAVGKFASGFLPEERILWAVVNFLVSLGVITMLFAMIFKLLPEVKISWRNVWVGAFVTALLFNLGKTLIGIYLGRSSVVSAYGAAGSFIILLLWVYYSAQIVFFGAEFTRVHAGRQSKESTPIRPEVRPLFSGRT